MRALPPPTLPLPADVGDWFGVTSLASFVMPEYQYAEHSLMDGRSHSLSSTESYATPIFEAGHYSWNTTTPASPESCSAGVLDIPVSDLVGSNFDPTVHTDKFWLKHDSEATQQYVAQPLSSNQVVVKEEVEVLPLPSLTDLIVPESRNSYSEYSTRCRRDGPGSCR